MSRLPPPVTTRTLVESVSSVLGQLLLHVPEAEAAAVDLQDMAVVEQAIEDGGGQDLVAGQHLRPFADALVGGDQGAAALVAMVDDLEQQVGLVPVQGLEAELVDDQQTGGHVTCAGAAADRRRPRRGGPHRPGDRRS